MMGNGMMDSSNMTMGWGGMFFGPLIMVGFFALIVFGIVMLVKWISRDVRHNLLVYWRQNHVRVKTSHELLPRHRWRT